MNKTKDKILKEEEQRKEFNELREKLLKDFEEKFLGRGEKKGNVIRFYGGIEPIVFIEIKNFLSQALDSIREDTLREVERGLVHSLPDLLNKKTKENLKVWYFLFFRNLIINLKTKNE